MCGCAIREGEQSDEIVRCDLHAAAPAMREALERIACGPLDPSGSRPSASAYSLAASIASAALSKTKTDV